MAEREKRRSTTFVTSRGAIINVAAPSIYIAPGVGPDDVTSPAEMREALREEAQRETIVYDGNVYVYENEVTALLQYKGKLLFSVSGKGTYSYDGTSVTKLFNDVMEWAYVIWNDKIFFRDGQTIKRYDGTTVSTVHTGGVYLSFTIYDFDGRLYAGGADAAGSSVVSTADGLTWSVEAGIPPIATFSRVLSLGVLGTTLYAFETWDVSTVASRIYRKVAGVWALYKTYASLASLGIMWEAPGNRQTIMSKYPWNATTHLMLGSHQGEAFIFDGTNTLKLFETYHSTAGNIWGTYGTLIKWTLVEGACLMVIGRGSNQMGYGELWLFDGFQVWKLLDTPFRLTTAEIYRGRLYVAGNTMPALVPAGDAALASSRGSSSLYSHNYGMVFALPLDALYQRKLPPSVRRVWVTKALLATLTLNSDDDEGAVLPCLGYGTKTIWVRDTTVATLTIYLDVDGRGTWVPYTVAGSATVPLAANTWKQIVIEQEGAIFLRLTVLQGAADGVLDARVILENGRY